MLARKALAGTAGAPKLYVEDVFSCFLYTGNSSTNTITNGIDLSTEGGLVWCKSRASAYDHALYDTARGINKELYSNTTAAQYSGTGTLTAFNSNGFTLGANGSANSDSSVSWTFRKAKKFFDVVTYTGTGSPRTVSHNLGSAPGCIIVKRYDSTGSWAVWHRSGTQTNGKFGAFLNTTGAYEDQANNLWGSETVAPDMNASTFGVGTAGSTNSNGSTYVAYLFAHDAGGFGDAGSDNVISCGSYTGNSGTQSISLGYEPQWLLIKKATASGTDRAWWLTDNMRGFSVGSGGDAFLFPNSSGTESSGWDFVNPTATGFDVTTSDDNFNTSGITYIYIAIRRGPMKTPTSSTNFFEPIAYTGTGTNSRVISSAITPDLVITTDRTGAAGLGNNFYDRLRGNGAYLISNSTGAEGADGAVSGAQFNSEQTGYKLGTSDGAILNSNTVTYISWDFRRVPGFFDVVCYTGTGSATTFSHNLGVAPELMIVKQRNSTNPWRVYSSPTGATKHLALNTDAAETTSSANWNDTAPTSTVFTVGTGTGVNGSGSTYVNYLFASVSGVSKVGSYTGNGSNQTINCGFTTGARFVLIKRTDGTGDWYIYDSARGIDSGSDPQIKLNTTSAEATGYDAVDPDNSGFIVNNDGTNFPINANGVTYIYLAIA